MSGMIPAAHSNFLASTSQIKVPHHYSLLEKSKFLASTSQIKVPHHYSLLEKSNFLASTNQIKAPHHFTLLETFGRILLYMYVTDEAIAKLHVM